MPPMETPDNTNLDTLDTLDILNDDSTESSDEETKETLSLETESDDEKKSDEDDEEEEVKEKKSDDESDDEEEIKLADEELEIVAPVKRKEILKKYPNLFKEFPYLQTAYYREQQYTEILPTIDDAKEAVTKAKEFDNFQQKLLKGDTETLLKTVKDQNPEAFNKIADDYLTTLSKVDNNAYYHVLGNVMKNAVISMVREARSSKNGDLEAAAEILNQFIFGTNQISEPTKLSSDKPKDDTVEQERRQFMTERFESVRDDLQTRVSNVLKATISQHIDPKAQMTDYLRNTAVKDSMDTVVQLIDKDTRFRSVLDKLWEKAFQEKFSKASTDRIRSAYLSRARTLLPAVIKSKRSEALKGLGKVREEKPERKGPIAPGRTSSNSAQKSQKDISKMSTLDIFNMD